MHAIGHQGSRMTQHADHDLDRRQAGIDDAADDAVAPHRLFPARLLLHAHVGSTASIPTSMPVAGLTRSDAGLRSALAGVDASA